MAESDPTWQEAFFDIKQALPNRTLKINDKSDGSLLKQLFIPLLIVPFGTIFFFKILYELIFNNGDLKIIIALVIAVIAIIVGISTGLDVFNKIKAKRILNNPSNQPWQITTNKVTCLDKEFIFNTIIEGKEKILSFEYKLYRPIVLANIIEDDHWVLAIKSKDNETALPIARKLDNLNLTEDERAKLRTAIEQYFYI